MKSPSQNSMLQSASPFSLPSSNAPVISGTAENSKLQDSTPAPLKVQEEEQKHDLSNLDDLLKEFHLTESRPGKATLPTMHSSTSRQSNAIQKPTLPLLPSPFPAMRPSITRTPFNSPRIAPVPCALHIADKPLERGSDSDTNVAEAIVDWQQVWRHAILRHLRDHLRERADGDVDGEGFFPRTREPEDEDDGKWYSCRSSPNHRESQSKYCIEKRFSVVRDGDVKEECLPGDEDRRRANKDVEDWEEIRLSPTTPPKAVGKRAGGEGWEMIDKEDCEEKWTMIEGEDVEHGWDMCTDAERYRISGRRGVKGKGIQAGVEEGKGKGKETVRVETWNGKMREFLEEGRREQERDIRNKGKAGDADGNLREGEVKDSSLP